MKYIGLGGRRGEGMFALIDDVDFKAVSAIRWHLSTAGYPAARIDGKIKTMHIFLMGQRSGLEIDHINQRKLDNRRGNLHHVTRGENVRNCLRSDNKCGARGVWFEARTGKFCAARQFMGKRFWLGRFKTKRGAMAAYAGA